MKKLLVCLAVIFGLVLLPAPLSAHSGGEEIHSFDTTIRIAPDSTAYVREVINYDFGHEQRHGIFRTIPIDYRDGDTNYYITARHTLTVDGKAHPIKAEVYEEQGNLVLKLGDPDKTVTGLQTFVITYSLSPAVMQKDGRPFLNLDVLGSGWKVPIENFSASIMLDKGAALSDIHWLGATGEQKPQITAKNILPYQPITINAFLPGGYTNTFLEPNKPRPFDIWKFFAEYWPLMVTLACVAIALAIVLWRWWLASSKRRSQTVVPEYEPPKGMTPGEVGLLDDDSSAMREITATVIDWAVRGYLKITRTEKKGLFGSVEYTLTQLKPGSDLSKEERNLYDAFFTQGKEVSLNHLDKSKMSKAVSDFRSSLKEKLSAQGYYDTKGHIIGRGTLTEEGAKQWAKVEGFQLYLGVVEKDRLNFSDAPEKTPERFNALLPYAVALGVEKQWAKQFEGIDVSEASSWYVGNMAAFSAINLANDMGSSFVSSVTSNAAVSSSGGSAGGGVGGGGGGSW